MSADEFEAQVSAARDDLREAWREMSDEDRRAYILRLQANAGDPPELTAVLANSELKLVWDSVPWLIQREYCLWINSGRTAFTRRLRSRASLRQAPREASTRNRLRF